jgi:hypothetical protein
MRNRGTAVSTSTSGPGLVMTIKDLNDILHEFCLSSITEYHKALKSRSETFSLIESHLRDQLYNKD